MTEPMRRKRHEKLTDKKVAALQRRAKRYVYRDPEQLGMYVRVMPKGPHVFAAVARDPYGKQVWATIGTADVLSIDEARDEARKAIRRIREGKPAFEPTPAKPDSYQAIADKWLKLYVAEMGLAFAAARSSGSFTSYVLPFWAKRDFVSIGREEVVDLLDHLVEKHGAWIADHVLAVIRKVANWHATRSSTYRSPFVVGMRRTRKEERKRDFSFPHQ